MPAQILVVEDEQIVAKDIQRTLQSLGYIVPATVATGDAAIQMVEELRPDLVLMDIRLRGGMDGIVTASVIRERWNIPVIYLTAHADPATLERAKIAEPFGYVLKPFEERDLHTTIEMALYKNQMDRKLRESERWLSVTLNSIGDAVIATDAAGRIVFINPVAQQLTGWAPEQAIGRPLTEVFQIVNEYSRQPVADPVANVFATGLVVGLANHTFLIARDGTERPIDDSAAPIRAPGGEMLGAVLVFRDVSERRRMEKSLEQRAAQLAEANHRKDDFLAMLGHELRNPLTSIVNGLEVLPLLGLPKGDATEIHGIVARQVMHMRRLIDDLLEVTRITHGKIVVERVQLDIVQVVRQAAEDQRRGIESQGAALRLELPPLAIYCEGDPTRLSQVMTNLLINATKFLGGPGTITVTVRARPDNNVVAISVRDSGIGMDSQTLRDIFQPFVQAAQSLSRSEGGLGLGLALVKGLVELHGGRVTATSAGIGQGSEFTIELPICAKSPSDLRETPEGPHRPAVRRRVLVIDDHQDGVFVVQRMLELAGHEVFAAGDAARGMELAREIAPEVILCDIGLPGGMNGYDFAAAIRSEPTLKDIYVVAVSGYGQHEDRRRARSAGFDKHVTKPVCAARLEELLTLLPRFSESELSE